MGENKGRTKVTRMAPEVRFVKASFKSYFYWYIKLYSLCYPHLHTQKSLTCPVTCDAFENLSLEVSPHYCLDQDFTFQQARHFSTCISAQYLEVLKCTMKSIIPSYYPAVSLKRLAFL